MRAAHTDRFDGWIAGLGTTSGLRVVVGRWRASPFGPFTDVMVERPDGHRVLLAPSQEIAAYVAATYRFDEVVVTPVHVDAVRGRWSVAAGPLALTFEVGGRPALGVMLRAVPRALATRTAWIRGAGAVARLVLPGVRTHGSAGGGRRELYAALDLRRIVAADVRWDGERRGTLAPVVPPVRFGFGSTPAMPALVRMVTRVDGPAMPFSWGARSADHY